MNLRELLQRPFWGPHDLSMAMGISLTTARSRLTKIRQELEAQGYINLNNSKAPTQVIIDRLNIDLKFLEETGGLDIELTSK